MINITITIFFLYTFVLIIIFWIIPTKKSKIIVNRIVKLMSILPFSKIIELFTKKTIDKT